MKKMLMATLIVGSVFAASAAEAPVPVASSTNTTAAVTSNRTVKVHSGCKPKRTGKRGGGVNIKHNCRTKTVQEKTQK